MSLSNGTYRARQWLLLRCFDRISRRPALSWRRHLAAAQYELAGRLLPLSPLTAPLTALIALVILVFAGYAPSEESGAPAANFLDFGICILAMHLWIPTSGTMLLPAGRRERFCSALALAVCGGLVVLAASLLLLILHQGMASLAPPISWRGEIHDFQPAELSPALVPLVLLPLNLILRIVCKKWLLVPQVLLVLIAAIVLREGGVTVREVSPVTAAALLSVSWALLVGVLYTTAFTEIWSGSDHHEQER